MTDVPSKNEFYLRQIEAQIAYLANGIDRLVHLHQPDADFGNNFSNLQNANIRIDLLEARDNLNGGFDRVAKAISNIREKEQE